jgi:hypothetical protein
MVWFLQYADQRQAAWTVPGDAVNGPSIHLLCEVTDAGTPLLTRYRCMVMTVDR